MCNCDVLNLIFVMIVSPFFVISHEPSIKEICGNVNLVILHKNNMLKIANLFKNDIDIFLTIEYTNTND